MIKVSIIVPVYNTEKYLKECVESILHQSYEYFEAIFIDDGSQDNSYSIINEFANRDKRIKLYHQNNAGVSAARNLGLKYATGDYIAFIEKYDFTHLIVEVDSYFDLFMKDNEAYELEYTLLYDGVADIPYQNLYVLNNFEEK